ncbi:MAG: TetR/AcrR family transcriptional regulator [Burkholderiales bacterium]
MDVHLAESPSPPATSAASILDAAEQLFAERGFDAVTIKEIAARARVNVALIYYYHDSKETLYQHIIQRFVSDLVGGATARLEAAATPEDAIRGVTQAQFEMLSARPHLPRLIIRELVDYQASHAAGVLRELAARVFRRLVATIEEGQARGVFRRDLDPRFAAFSTIAQLPYFFIARPALGAVALGSAQSADPATAAAFARHAGDFAVDALRAPIAPPSNE